MTLVVVAAFGCGLGITALIRSMRPAPSPLHTRLSPLDRAELGDPGRAAGQETASRRARSAAGRRLAAAMTDHAWTPPRVTRALALTRTALPDICGQATVTAAIGGVAMPAAWALAMFGGAHLPISLPLWAAIVGAGAGWLVPFAAVLRDARVARRELRRTVGVYLDLVVLCLAGGMGVEGALHAAADVTESPSSSRIVEVLEHARHAGESPWSALGELGSELGVSELTELAGAVTLAGTEGTRVRATLTAKATSIRRHELAEAETEANTVTERLFLPAVLLLVGFLVFLGYPAIARISTGL